MWRFIVLAIAVARTTVLAQATDFVFKIPAGWTRTERGDSTLLVAPGHATYIVLAGTPMVGDAKTAFGATLTRITGGTRVLQGGQIAMKHFDAGYDALYTTASVVDRAGQRYDFALVGTVNGARFETVAYVTSDFRSDRYEAGKKALGDFMNSVRFASTTASSAPASSAPASSAPTHDAAGVVTNLTLPKGTGKFDGVYRAVGQVDLTPVGPGGVHHIGAKYVTFFPDARVVEGFPDGGMDRLNEDEYMKIHPTGWGTYVMNGETGTITFARASIYDQTTITWQIHEYPDRLEVHGETYRKMESGDDAHLTGTFRRDDYQTLSSSAQQGITFTPDGRFKDEGIFKAAFVQNRTSRGYEFDDGMPGAGTYRIKHYSLELTYDNGRSKQSSFYLGPTKPGDITEFWFNEYRFVRVP